MDRKKLLDDFDKFTNFCFNHGGTLKNHKAFGEMAKEIRGQLQEFPKQKISFDDLDPLEGLDGWTCGSCDMFVKAYIGNICWNCGTKRYE